MPWRAVLAASAAALVGNGLARFAYSPLLPVLIAEHWFTPAAAAYLGAANLLGYLCGALLARTLGERLGAPFVLRGGMLAAAVSLLACCTALPFAWFFVWRLVSGIAGGVLMILAPSVVLPHVPAARRGLATGLVITGVGLGIALSGTAVPLLLHWGLTATWLALGLASLALTGLAWRAWPAGPVPGAPVATSAVPSAPASATPISATPISATPVSATPVTATPRGTVAISVTYGLCAVGLVPHMVFLVDYVARGQGRGIAAGSLAWVLLGLGALLGAVVVGFTSDRTGPAAAMRIVLATELACVLALAFVTAPVASALFAFVAGLCLSGISTAMLARIQQAAGADPAARQRGWSQATVAWAIGQAAAAYGLAWLYARTGGYGALLGTAASALVVAALVEAAIDRGAGAAVAGQGRAG